MTSKIRVQTKTTDKFINENVKGKLPSDLEYDILLTGTTRVVADRNKLLCVYLPGVLKDTSEANRNVLSKIRNKNEFRQTAAGARGFFKKNDGRMRVSTVTVSSEVIGYLDPHKNNRHKLGDRHSTCRLTTWTGTNTVRFKSLFPLFQQIGAAFQEHVPDRYAAQMAYVRRTPDEYVISGTPFTTITVNNTYPTGVHKDSGDLDIGFSCLAVFRRGDYKGGRLTFPQYRVAVDMQDGDLLLMDAHQWHGNTPLYDCSDDHERVSLVLYFRTNMVKCPSENIRGA